MRFNELMSNQRQQKQKQQKERTLPKPGEYNGSHLEKTRKINGPGGQI